jgi:hypothetical protein
MDTQLHFWDHETHLYYFFYKNKGHYSEHVILYFLCI